MELPAIFVCENNGYAISVPTSKSQATPDIADRARGFGIPAKIVDGNDVLAVRAAMVESLQCARGGAGPHDLVRMVRQGRVYESAAESQYYAEPKRLELLGYLSCSAMGIYSRTLLPLPGGSSRVER